MVKPVIAPSQPYNKLNWDKITNTFHYMIIINKNQFCFLFFFYKVAQNARDVHRFTT